MSAKWQQQQVLTTSPADLTPYEGAIDELTLRDTAYFQDRYEIPANVSHVYIKRGDGIRYLLPIWTPHGAVRGYVSRAPWPGAPLQTYFGKKALTYMHERGPVQSYYRSVGTTRTTVIVEDQLSAIKASVAGFNAWAMLGMPVSENLTGYNGADRVREIASLQPQEVVVALDADATDKAFWFARKWGLAFNSIRVAILERDIKDTPLADIPAALGINS